MVYLYSMIDRFTKGLRKLLYIFGCHHNFLVVFYIISFNLRID